MARQEHEREDLLAEATALVERIEIALPAPDAEQRIVIGFRRDGSVSLYFGEEPAWHFNSAGALRRAYAHGRLYKAERGALVALDRRRTECEMELIRHELSAEETAALTGELRRGVIRLAEAIDSGSYRRVGQVPPEADVLTRARPLLADLVKEVSIAASPRVC